MELVLVGLLEESLLPGETRKYLKSVFVPAKSGEKLAQGQELAVVSVTSPVELPSLVSGRHATVGRVVTADEDSVTLLGERRARVKTAKGREAPYPAQLELLEVERPEKLLAAAISLLSALDQGIKPDLVGWEEPLRGLLFEVVRALATPEERKDLLLKPFDEALTVLTRKWVGALPAHAAITAVEQMVTEVTQKPELTMRRRHELWSEMVALQKRLDVYDPSLKLDEGDAVSRLTKRLMQGGLPPAAMAAAKRELRLLGTMSGTHHDYATYLSHLDLMARLPWHPDPVQAVDLARVSEALDRQHHGLEKVKKRVLEFLATRALGGSASNMVLCLAGPPGVGKTTIARAIAEALGRKFVRIALGGVHDEAEIRGHRLSFVAAGPGRIISGIAQAGSMNALVLLDELDKIGTDRGRSPGAALHEVLDPEQNTHFQDNYLGVPYDLSHVLFIATANDPSLVAPTLRDRLEPVEIEGYTGLEKARIVKSQLLTRLREEHGLPKALEIPDDLIERLIDGYTKEAGVRQLKRSLAALHRSRALGTVMGSIKDGPVTLEEIEEVLGAPQAAATRPTELPAGVAIGLSVGAEGGALLYIEASTSRGRGELKMTGRLGEVAKESVELARGYLRARPELYGISEEMLASDIHVHMPEASVPKDGPSAGVAIFLALVSALTKSRVRADVAMTGETTLTGRVLPVGGVRAKVLAAERAGLKEVFLPADCRGDVPSDVSVQVVFIRSLDEVVARGLVPSGQG